MKRTVLKFLVAALCVSMLACSAENGDNAEQTTAKVASAEQTEVTAITTAEAVATEAVTTAAVPTEFTEGYYEVAVLDGKAELLNYTGKEKEVIIPSEIAGYKVCTIGDWAFSLSLGIEKVVIPEGVTHIGESAFFGCRSLTAVEIPTGVETIENNAFKACTALEEIAIPDSVTSIGAETFHSKESVTIKCSEGSYADTYAKENGIKTVY